MSTEKLTLENIAPYLPYGLKIQTRKGILTLHSLNVNTKWAAWCTMDSLSEIDSEKENAKNFIGRYPLGKGFKVKEIKPLLRPMDLIKPIIVEGKEIIPIVELAKIGLFRLIAYEISFDRQEIITSYTSLGYPEACYRSLHYRNGSFTVCVYDSNLAVIGYQSIRNQNLLFKKLYEWKLDVDGLFEKGLAIDATTLNINPYNS